MKSSQVDSLVAGVNLLASIYYYSFAKVQNVPVSNHWMLWAVFFAILAESARREGR